MQNHPQNRDLFIKSKKIVLSPWNFQKSIILWIETLWYLSISFYLLFYPDIDIFASLCFGRVTKKYVCKYSPKTCEICLSKFYRWQKSLNGLLLSLIWPVKWYTCFQNILIEILYLKHRKVATKWKCFIEKVHWRYFGPKTQFSGVPPSRHVTLRGYLCDIPIGHIRSSHPNIATHEYINRFHLRGSKNDSIFVITA